MTTNNDLPTLPIGTVLQFRGGQDREVIRSEPGFCLTKGPSGVLPWAWLDGAWRRHSNGEAWTVKPEPIESHVEQWSSDSWVLRVNGASFPVVIDAQELPDHMDPHAVAMAIADLLTGMANEVQS